MFTDRQIEIIIKMQKQYVPLVKIREAIAVSRHVYNRKAKKAYLAGKLTHSQANYIWHEARRRKLKEIYKEQSLEELAKYFGVNEYTVKNDLIHLGLYETARMKKTRELREIEQRLRETKKKNRLKRLKGKKKSLPEFYEVENAGVVNLKLKADKVRYREVNARNHDKYKSHDLVVLQRYKHYVLFKHVRSGQKESFLNVDINDMLANGQMEEVRQ